MHRHTSTIWRGATRLDRAQNALLLVLASLAGAACSAPTPSSSARRAQPGEVGVFGAAGSSAAVNGGKAGLDNGAVLTGQSGSGGSVGTVNTALTVHVEDPHKLTIEILTLACAGDCADIEAVASGGNPPYTYAWEDGSKDAKRHVCLDTSKSLRITVTDTAIVAVELGYAAHTSSADVQATVMACSDAGVPPPVTTGCMQPAASATCKLASGAMLPEDITVKLIDQQQYFAGGADLPTGRYRLTYLDGCFNYGVPVATYGWTVHASKAAGLGCFLIGADGSPLMPTPGTDGLTVDAGTFETYAKCVAANCSQAPLDFDFAGGKLGVARNGGTAFAEFDDSDGSDMGGRGPTFRLSRLDPCP
jgi:hypothetical protein